MLPTAWWANIMQQTTIRALTKLEFAYGLAMRMAEAVNDVIAADASRCSASSAATSRSRAARCCSPRSTGTTAARASCSPTVDRCTRCGRCSPIWFPRVNEILITIGSHNLLADAEPGDARRRPPPAAHRRVPPRRRTTSTPRTGPRSTVSRGTSSARTSGARNDLYERNYLASARTNRTGAHMVYADHERPKALVEAMLAAGRG